VAIGFSLMFHVLLLGGWSISTSPQSTALSPMSLHVSLAGPEEKKAAAVAVAPPAPMPANAPLPPQPAVAAPVPVPVERPLLPKKPQPDNPAPARPQPAPAKQAATDGLSDDEPAWMQRAASANHHQRHRPADWIAFKVSVDAGGTVLHFSQVSTEDANVDNKALLIEEIKHLKLPDGVSRTLIVSGPPLVIETDTSLISEYLPTAP
jgi:hypothetical protein